ncbi:MAG TPA: FAD-dependent oxidoreductase [Mycobacteriales bacterium]|nr:FAD-dependent oxidoreductase [Mycobacteriales bacterium]
MSSYAGVSLWMDQVGSLTPRAALDGDVEADVAIVGAGYTGLWTAYYLAVADPSLRIVVVEREVAGFGASGRNGGWCSALFAASREAVARAAGGGAAGEAAAVELQAAMVETVDEVGRVAAAEGIDCGYAKGGTLTLATTPAQVERVRAHVTDDQEWGLDGSRWLSAAEVRERVAVAGVLGAAFTPHCARVQPAALVRGLARAVVERGVRLHERTAATAIRPGMVVTERGSVRAPVVVRATEAYTAELPGQRRTVLPIYSLIVATAPLPPAAWAELGWDGAETLTDGRHLLVYAQRTADGRVALGGRGAPYHLRSRTEPAYDRDERVFAELERTMRALLPGIGDAPVTHRWGGPLAAARDWFPSVGLDRGTGLAWAGGYAGDGVGTANLAGRTLADLIRGQDTRLTRLPWVGHRSRRWEPEPLRWLGATAVRRLATAADAAETRTGVPSRRATLIDRLTGG